MTDRNDLKLSGVGSVNGGKFRNVSISGTASVNGDLECEEFSGSGVATVGGDLTARRVRVSGTGRVEGRVQAEEDVVVSGASEFCSDVNAKTVSISGATTIRGNLNAESVKLRGGVKIGGDCEADRFDAKGGFSIGGLLSAQDVSVVLYTQCSAREIGGGKVDIREDTSGWKRFAQDLGIIPVVLLRVESVEADEIYLEATGAKAVRGGTVRIGPKCEIDLVEYTGDLTVDPGSKVAASRKVEG